jgi:hypothetical protein
MVVTYHSDKGHRTTRRRSTLGRGGMIRTREIGGNVRLLKPDGRRPVSERDAVRSQVIDALEAQEIKGDRQ